MAWHAFRFRPILLLRGHRCRRLLNPPGAFALSTFRDDELNQVASVKPAERQIKVKNLDIKVLRIIGGIRRFLRKHFL